jgi:hypothetical protein
MIPTITIAMSGAVGHDLAHGRAHLGGVKPHHGHGRSRHGGRVLDHAVKRLAPRILVEPDVGDNLAADEALEEGGDVAADEALEEGGDVAAEASGTGR